ncbi:MAG: alpha/beta fold hydrolase [Pseudooceanicola sp.]
MAEAGPDDITEAPFFSDVDDGPEGGRAVWARTDDGLRIRVGAWPLEGAKGTILLFPGRTEYVEKYGRAARDLAARGYATLAVDWRGQGLGDRMTADPLRGHVGRFADFQRDVAAVLRAARAMDLPEPWHLVGHSMGGCIGLRALHEGLPVASAVFTAPMWGIPIPPLLRPLARLWAFAGKAFGLGHLWAPGVVRDAYVLVEPFEGNKLTRDADMYDYMRRQTLAHRDFALGGPTLGWVHEAFRETRALSRLPAPGYPTLTFLGTNERIVDVPAIRARMADWPDGRLEDVPGGEHEVMMDAPETRRALFDAMAAHFDAHG